MDLSKISYKVLRKSRKRSATITINRNNEVLISVPKGFSDSMVKEILQRQASWIQKKLTSNEVLQKKYPPKSYLPGDSFPFLGKNYTLELVESSKRRVELTETALKVSAKPEELYGEGEDNLPSMVQAWYEGQAHQILKERIRFYEDQMEVKSGTLEIKTINSFWGSCASDGYLRFNARLLMAPLEVVDYVVVHELAHLRHRNHSKSFWREVENVVPDYKVKRRWLSRHGHFLTF